MQIAFDAKRIFQNFTGLGNYSRTLISELALRLPELEAYLMAPKISDYPETQRFLNNPSFRVISPPPNRKLLWRTRGMVSDLKKLKPKLYHGLSNELPLGIQRSGIPSVVTIHDLIFKHFPQQYGRWDRTIYDLKFKYACQKADRIVAISEATKADIVDFYQIDPDHINVIYQACDERFLVSKLSDFRLPQVEDIPQKRDIPKSTRGEENGIYKTLQLPKTYSLYLGSIIERKNLMSIIEALALLPKDLKHPLVIVGRGQDYKKRCIERAQKLKVDHLLLFRQVDNEQLPAVYRGARCFLYPSLAEGFGIPVIEALNSGTPVITSNISSLPEAAGPDSLLVNPTLPEAIADAWAKLLQDDVLHTRVAQAGLKYAERFRADVVVPQMIELYNAI
ncbi:MAG: glycosyltransferase family 1 protein [Bacteroidota bacterium]